jgi:hypothetical protein
MDSSSFQSLLLSLQAPWLPEAATQYWGLHAAWGLVLGSLTLLWGARYHFKWRGWAAAAVAAWTLLPGPASPSYWLGLAFQSPSLMSVVLCVVWVARSLEKKSFAVLGVTSKDSHSTLLASAGILLGWVLLGDTLAWWPVSIYAWGFSTWALVLTCVPAFSLWCIGGRDHDVKAFTVGFSVVLLLFVVTRLPSGNLWDALLDPWLWIVLQVMGLRVLILRLLHLLRVSPATRA